MQNQIIEHFITRTLLGEESKKLKVAVTDKELDDKLNEYKKRLPKGMTLESALQQGGVGMEEMYDNIRFSLQVEQLVFRSTLPFGVIVIDDFPIPGTIAGKIGASMRTVRKVQQEHIGA